MILILKNMLIQFATEMKQSLAYLMVKCMKSAPNITKSLKAAISEVQNTQTYEFQTIVTQERIIWST